MNKWQAEELEGRGNRKEKRTCSKLSFHSFICLQVPTMYYVPVQGVENTQACTNYEREEGQSIKALLFNFWNGVFPNITLKALPGWEKGSTIPSSHNHQVSQGG